MLSQVLASSTRPPGRVRWRTVLVIVLLLIFPALHLYAWKVEPNRLVVRERAVAGAGPWRIAHIADAQFKPHERRHMEKTVRVLNGLDVDFVVFTGDFVEEQAPLGELLTLLADIRHPVYGVLGNHDRWVLGGEEIMRLGETLAATGGRLLINEAHPLNEDWDIVGLDSSWGGEPDYERAFGQSQAPHKLFLLHEPLSIEKTPYPFDLAMAGHSHGGQVRLPVVGAIHVPDVTGPYVWGLYETPKGPLHVTSGVGVLKTTPRFLCPPEIALLHGS